MLGRLHNSGFSHACQCLFLDSDGSVIQQKKKCNGSATTLGQGCEKCMWTNKVSQKIQANLSNRNCTKQARHKSNRIQFFFFCIFLFPAHNVLFCGYQCKRSAVGSCSQKRAILLSSGLILTLVGKGYCLVTTSYFAMQRYAT